MSYKPVLAHGVLAKAGLSLPAMLKTAAPPRDTNSPILASARSSSPPQVRSRPVAFRGRRWNRMPAFGKNVTVVAQRIKVAIETCSKPPTQRSFRRLKKLRHRTRTPKRRMK
jgi:hypothetical protein